MASFCGGRTRDEQVQDIQEQGLPLLDKAIEIIQYFQPKKYFLENPASGRMRMFLKGPFTDVTYHAYGYDYKKPTRIWHNLVTFEPKVNLEKPTAFIGKSGIGRLEGEDSSNPGGAGQNHSDRKIRLLCGR